MRAFFQIDGKNPLPVNSKHEDQPDNSMGGSGGEGRDHHVGLTGESCELVGCLWSARVLIHAELLPFHKWLRAPAERSRATMINAVIKPAGRLLKCCTRSPGEGERRRGAHRKQISHQTLMYYRFTHTHTRTRAPK